MLRKVFLGTRTNVSAASPHLAVLGDSAEFDEIAKIAPKERVLEATVNLEKRFPERVHECSIDLGCVEHARVDGLGPHLLEQSLGGIEAPLRAQERAKDKEQEKKDGEGRHTCR